MGMLLVMGCGESAERGEPVVDRLDAAGDADAAQAAEQLQLQTAELTAMMRGLLGANEEFKAATQQGNLNHDGGFPVNWSAIPNQQLSSSERFVFGMRMVEDANRMVIAALHASGPEVFEQVFADRDGDGTEEIYDLWGNELEYRAFNDGMGQGPGTGVDNAALPLSPGPMFVSAGPDGVFGPDAQGKNDDVTNIDEPVYRD